MWGCLFLTLTGDLLKPGLRASLLTLHKAERGKVFIFFGKGNREKFSQIRGGQVYFSSLFFLISVNVVLAPCALGFITFTSCITIHTANLGIISFSLSYPTLARVSSEPMPSMPNHCLAFLSSHSSSMQYLSRKNRHVPVLAIVMTNSFLYTMSKKENRKHVLIASSAQG